MDKTKKSYDNKFLCGDSVHSDIIRRAKEQEKSRISDIVFRCVDDYGKFDIKGFDYLLNKKESKSIGKGKDTLTDLKEFREKYWDKTLPLNEAYEKYINIYSDKGKENEGITNSDEVVMGTYSPLKSEFKTSEEILKKWVFVDNTKTLREKDDFLEKKWLSKEDYEKRVEEFRKRICFCDKTPYHINKGICKNCDLINKILLGEKMIHHKKQSWI